MSTASALWSSSPTQQTSRIVSVLLVFFAVFHASFGETGKTLAKWAWLPLVAIVGIALSDMYTTESPDSLLFLLGYIITAFVVFSLLRYLIVRGRRFPAGTIPPVEPPYEDGVEQQATLTTFRRDFRNATMDYLLAEGKEAKAEAQKRGIEIQEAFMNAQEHASPAHKLDPSELADEVDQIVRESREQVQKVMERRHREKTREVARSWMGRLGGSVTGVVMPRWR